MFAAVLWICATAQAEVLIAAASDLTHCVEPLQTEFKRVHPALAVKASIGASGNVFAQIARGAPFDIFLSADMEYPRRLIAAGGADEQSLTKYAVGHLVLWTRDEQRLDVGRGLELLRDSVVRRVAIPNPEHAPYGRAAKAAIEAAKVWDVVRAKLVVGENAAQAAQFVETGNAEVGLVPLSLVLGPHLAGRRGQYFRIPPELHPPLDQGAVLTRRGAKNPDARAFLEFLSTPEARETLERYGFSARASE